MFSNKRITFEQKNTAGFDDIYISEAGCSITQAKLPYSNNTELLIIKALSDNLSIVIKGQTITLLPNEIIVTDDNDVTFSNNQKLIYLLIGGAFVRKHIDSNKLNRKLSFTGLEDIIIITNQFREMMFNDTIMPYKKLIKLVFAIVLDIHSYEEEATVYPKLIYSALHIINNEYCTICGVEDIAEKLGITKSHLIRAFRSTLNITPGNYLVQVRIKKAKMYLLSMSMDMQTVAYLTGFSCANYFGKVFKKHTGISPSDFIKESMKIDVDITKEIPDVFYV